MFEQLHVFLQYIYGLLHQIMAPDFAAFSVEFLVLSFASLTFELCTILPYLILIMPSLFFAMTATCTLLLCIVDLVPIYFLFTSVCFFA